MKKILFLIDNLKGGGAEKAIKIIVEELYDKGYNPAIVLLEDQLDYDLKKNIERYALIDKITKYNFIFLFLKLLRLLKNINPDIIYATNTKAQILSLLTKYLFKAKRVVNIQVDLTKQYEDRKYIFNFFNKLLNQADTYSFISKGIFRNLKDKIPIKKSVFIPNAVDFCEIDKLKIEQIEDECRYIFEKKVFITIGRLTEQKGQWVLLDAFSKIKNDVNLVILGDGEKEKELKKITKELNIDQRVFFLGFQKNPFKFLYHADVFVLSSLWEGFGNVIIEAMRCGLPIISADCPSGPREILAPKSDIYKRVEKENELCEFGILTPVNNSVCLAQAMENMVNNRLANRYKQQSILRANDYDKQIIIEKFIEKFLN